MCCVKKNTIHNTKCNPSVHILYFFIVLTKRGKFGGRGGGYCLCRLQSQRGNKMCGKINTSKEKIDLLPSKNLILLRQTKVNFNKELWCFKV